MIYFIREVGGELVKIGYSDNPTKRLIKMQCDNPRNLEIVRSYKQGTRVHEKKLHYHYGKQFVRGEWFKFSEDMMSIDPDILPEKEKQPKAYICDRRSLLYEKTMLDKANELRVKGNIFITNELLARSLGMSKTVAAKYKSASVNSLMDLSNKENFGTSDYKSFGTILRLSKVYKPDLKAYYIYVTAGVSGQSYFKHKKTMLKHLNNYLNVELN